MEMLRSNYHPDHASASLSNLWITDNTGEDWVDQRNSSWNAPYTFSGKEKDVETGYGYFGARYYDSGLSIWLSVDPMSDKYPSMSPYNYCANNPVILVDPDGREIDEAAGPKDPPLKSWLKYSQNNTSDVKPPYADPQSSQQGNTTSQFGNSTPTNNSFLFSNTMNVIGYGLTGAGVATSSATTFGNLSQKMSLLKEGYFMGNYGGADKVWKMGFFGNNYISSSTVAFQKLKFMKNVNSLNGAKFGGYLFGGLSLGISMTQFATTNNPGLKFEYAFDTFMSGVGFIGLPGAAASGMYFGMKPLIKMQVPYLNQATSGFNGLGLGFHSINLMPFK